MPLIEVLPNTLIHTATGLCVAYNPGVPKVTVSRGDGHPVVFVSPDDVAAVWEAFRRHVAPQPVIPGDLRQEVAALGRRVEEYRCVAANDANEIHTRLDEIEAELDLSRADGSRDKADVEPEPLSQVGYPSGVRCDHCGSFTVAFKGHLRCFSCGNAMPLSPDGPKDRAGERPKIVCLCGSTRFKQAFIEANARETRAGRIVLSVGFFNHADRLEITEATKIAADELHFRKIELADEILVLNVGGYIGESTRREIAHAESLGKPVRYLESPRDGGRPDESAGAGVANPALPPGWVRRFNGRLEGPGGIVVRPSHVEPGRWVVDKDGGGHLLLSPSGRDRYFGSEADALGAARGLVAERTTGPTPASCCPGCGGTDLSPDRDSDMAWCRPCACIWRKDELVAGSGDAAQVGEVS